MNLDKLALLHAASGFALYQSRVQDIASMLEDKAAIPMVGEQMELIQDVQSDAWWQDVTLPMLEGVRRRLRLLVQFLDTNQRKPLYTDFEDEIGAETTAALPGVAVGTDHAKFVAKARAFLRQHFDHASIAKLRTNEPLTAVDLIDLEQLLAASGVGTPKDIRRAATHANGMGRFVRSLVGLDRGAAKEALAEFLEGRTLDANQVEFVSLVIDHLAEFGLLDAGRLYESPFTDLTPRGPDAIFDAQDLDALLRTIDAVRRSAVAG